MISPIQCSLSLYFNSAFSLVTFCYFLSDISLIELGYLSESCAHKKGLYLRIPEPSNFHFLNDEYRLLPPAGMEGYFLSQGAECENPSEDILGEFMSTTF